MAQRQIAHTESTTHTSVTKKNMLYRTQSLETLRVGKRKIITVDLDTPVGEILNEVVFDSALLDPAIVKEIMGNAFAESRAGQIPRKWSFEFIGITIDDKKLKEFGLIQEISNELKNGPNVVDEVQSLESFLDPKSLSLTLSNALSNKKLQVLTPLEIIFFAYANKVNGIDAFMPYFPLDKILRYQKPNSPGIDVLSGMIPKIIFPSALGRIVNKVTVKGHMLSGSEIDVRMNSNSYFIYKIDSQLKFN